MRGPAPWNVAADLSTRLRSQLPEHGAHSQTGCRKIYWQEYVLKGVTLLMSRLRLCAREASADAR
jgi:hypothetical protein